MTSSDTRFQFTSAGVVEEGRAATKRIERHPDGTITKSACDVGATWWKLHPVEQPDHASMAEYLLIRAARRRVCLLAGAPLPHIDLSKPNYRRHNNGDPRTNTMGDAQRGCLVVDADDAVVPPGLGRGERVVEAAKWLRDNRLPVAFADVRMVVIPSAGTGLSAGPDGDWSLLRCKMFFLLTAAHTLADLYAWARGAQLSDHPLDPKMLLPSQPIFSARPIFVGLSDPVPVELHAVVVDGARRDRVDLDLKQFEPRLLQVDAWNARVRAEAGGDWQRVLIVTLGGDLGFCAPLTTAIGIAARAGASDEEVCAVIAALLAERADPARRRHYGRHWVIAALRNFRRADGASRQRIRDDLGTLFAAPSVIAPSLY